MKKFKIQLGALHVLGFTVGLCRGLGMCEEHILRHVKDAIGAADAVNTFLKPAPEVKEVGA